MSSYKTILVTDKAVPLAAPEDFVVCCCGGKLRIIDEWLGRDEKFEVPVGCADPDAIFAQGSTYLMIKGRKLWRAQMRVGGGFEWSTFTADRPITHATIVTGVLERDILCIALADGTMALLVECSGGFHTESMPFTEFGPVLVLGYAVSTMHVIAADSHVAQVWKMLPDGTAGQPKIFNIADSLSGQWLKGAVWDQGAGTLMAISNTKVVYVWKRIDSAMWLDGGDLPVEECQLGGPSDVVAAGSCHVACVCNHKIELFSAFTMRHLQSYVVPTESTVVDMRIGQTLIVFLAKHRGEFRVEQIDLPKIESPPSDGDDADKTMTRATTMLGSLRAPGSRADGVSFTTGMSGLESLLATARGDQ